MTTTTLPLADLPAVGLAMQDPVSGDILLIDLDGHLLGTSVTSP